MDCIANSGRLLLEKRAIPAMLVCNEGLAEGKEDQAALYVNQGVAYLMMKKYDEALTSFTAACDLNPDDADAVHNKSIAVSLKENPDDTVKMDDLRIKGV